MVQVTINTDEIEKFVMRTFGNKKITAITTGEVVLLIADTQHYYSNAKKETHSVALNNLCGMFKNTNLLSSDDFAKNKEKEKIIEQEKFKNE